jgi:hypothetical protein
VIGLIVDCFVDVVAIVYSMGVFVGAILGEANIED